ncbi:MBL fold metallo-hydrolase [Pasteurella sp. PK-2025]|uniref:MBL fold metallo-hydrolase n=1 Tax=Pasteurella sp. PK-2025 TaxID=3413133 RepID=UPI003C72CD85
MKKCNRILCLLFSLCSLSSVAEQCQTSDFDVVVLGSGGPEIQLFRHHPTPPSRASASYLVREKGQAKFLVDLGSGALQNFARSGAKIEDLKGILITHFHVDHINDLPALLKASFFSSRQHTLPIYGPTGNAFIPDTATFLQRLFGEDGAYSYLSDFLTGEAQYAVQPLSVNADKQAPIRFQTEIDGFTLQAIGTEHGLLPALAWRIEKKGCAVVFSGDTSNQGRTLNRLIEPGDFFIAHNAVPESSQDRVAQKLHMKPSEIGFIAQQRNVKSLLLSHLMRRTEDAKAETQQAIQTQYQGEVQFAEDCNIYALNTGKKSSTCQQE